MPSKLELVDQFNKVILDAELSALKSGLVAADLIPILFGHAVKLVVGKELAQLRILAENAGLSK